MENSALYRISVSQLQQAVSRYPWFSYAREVLLYRLVELEPGCLENQYKDNLPFYPVRESVYARARGIRRGVELGGSSENAALGSLLEPEEAIDFDRIAKEVDALEQEDCEPESGGEAPPKPRYVAVGGDYFSREDFNQLREEEKAAEIKFSPLDAEEAGEESAPLQPESRAKDGFDYESLNFFTETLARIYADQGYYDKAIEVYAKLILLYPEKSAYFASLVNEIKSKNL